MVIGVDLDDTITNSFEDLMPFFAEYFGLDFNYCKENNYSYNNFPEELKEKKNEFIKYLQEKKLLGKISVKENVIQVLKELHELGCKIIIITSRNDSILTNAFLETKSFLEQNGITYDELYCEHDKHKVLLAEGVEMFIDDSIKGLIYNKDACKYHILFSSVLNQKEESEFTRALSWIEIRDIVKDLINKKTLSNRKGSIC